METKIVLDCDPKKLHEMYFRNRDDQWFFGPRTRKESIGILSMPLVLGAAVYFSRVYDREDVLFVGVLICMMLTYSFFLAFFRIRRWKKSVLKFINESSETLIEFSYDEESCSHAVNGHFLKREWAEVVSADIVDEQYITLKLEDMQLVLPVCCMKQEESKILTEMILQKVKNVQRS